MKTNLNGMQIGALAALAAVLLYALVASWPLVGAALTARDASGDGDSLEAQGEAFEADLALALDRVHGRSLFWQMGDRPADPPPPPPAPPPRDPGPPPLPTRYGGPDVIAMINGQVWLSNGDRIGVGEEAGGVEVVSLSAPWYATLLWDGVEFDVPLFEADEDLVRTVSPDAGVDDGDAGEEVGDAGVGDGVEGGAVNTTELGSDGVLPDGASDAEEGSSDES